MLKCKNFYIFFSVPDGSPDPKRSPHFQRQDARNRHDHNSNVVRLERSHFFRLHHASDQQFPPQTVRVSESYFGGRNFRICRTEHELVDSQLLGIHAHFWNRYG